MAASIFVCCSGVRFRLASETVQAGFEALPTFFVQSPCSPANTAPVANIPATTNAIILVIVQPETVNYPMSFNHLRKAPLHFFRGAPGSFCRKCHRVLLKIILELGIKSGVLRAKHDWSLEKRFG